MDQAVNNFVNKYNGHRIDQDGYYGTQCWDLVARFAVEVVGCPSMPTGSGGAEGIFRLFQNPLPQYFERIANNPNDPNQVPPKGAIVVWGASFSPPFGHTALCISADPSGITVLEQNGALDDGVNRDGVTNARPNDGIADGVAYIKKRSFSGVSGWLVAKGASNVANNPIQGDVENIIGELWGRAPNANDLQAVNLSWHDFIYGAVQAYPFQDRKKIIDVYYPAVQKQYQDALGVAETRSTNFQDICDAAGVKRQPDEQATTKDIVDTIAKLKAAPSTPATTGGFTQTDRDTLNAIQKGVAAILDALAKVFRLN